MLSTLLLFDNKVTELFGDPMFWFGLVIAIGLVGVILLCIKYWQQGGKTILFSLFVLVNVVISAYCLIQVNFYYSTKGGIHGVISGIFSTNEVKIVDNVNFEFTNIELRDKGDGTYSATILSDEVLSLDGLANIGVYVNELPCSYVDYAGDYIISDYVYTFLDEHKNPLCTDTLTMRFAFYENSTSLSVSTSGGSEAVKYWHYYFNKNDFKVRIGESEYISSDNLNFVTGNVSNISSITFSNREEKSKVYYYKNSTIELPVIETDTFVGWYDGENTYKDSYTIKDNVELIALYEEASVSMSFFTTNLNNVDYGSATLVDVNVYSDTNRTCYDLYCPQTYTLKFTLVSNSGIDVVVETDGEYTLTEDNLTYTLSYTNATTLRVYTKNVPILV